MAAPRLRLPEPPPRRRKRSTRGERYKLWRVKGPVGPVTITQLAAAHSDGGSDGEKMAAHSDRYQ